MDETKMKTTTILNERKVKHQPSQLIRRLQEYRQLYLLMIPGLIVVLVFAYFPMYGALIAFKDYRFAEGILGSPWVGFKHFQGLFNDPYFYVVLKNTLIISSLKIAFGLIVPITFAILLNELTRSVFKRITQTVSYLPHFMSWVVLGGICFTVFSLDGPVNEIRSLFGLDPKLFIGDQNGFRALLIVTDIWQSMGWEAVIYLAAIAGIDHSLYEAATVDGANRWHRIRYITLPSIVPTICILLILRTANILNAGFDQIFNLYSVNVYPVADIIDTYVYRKGLEQMQYSFSTAVGLFKSVIGLALIVTSNKIVKRLGGKENALW